MKALRTSAAMAMLALAAICANAQSVVTLQDTDEEGKYTIEASVNGVGILTYYTEENWFVSMSTTTYLFLYENGYIKDGDVKGLANLKMPDGSTNKGASFVIRKLKIGDHILITDIPAFVVRKQTVPLVIGSSAFESLGDVAREGNRIIIGDLEDVESLADVVDPVDSLRLAVQNHLEAEEYEEAASCLRILDGKGALNMLNHYQYAVILGLLERDSENISVSNSWLEANEGKSLTMDYWIYNGLGAAYARLKDNTKAIECYEKAASAYFTLYNTSEKGIKAGNFHDENLGATLYRLGRLYAAEGKVQKTESRCSLAAKCGYQPAIDFCTQYKIKY
ncbi:MAG: tetratricopeptide repeat protein [Bacteroidales bacterium]|nr:tetratricopeptide repeat protein [Bacteroidales bacterium]